MLQDATLVGASLVGANGFVSELTALIAEVTAAAEDANMTIGERKALQERGQRLQSDFHAWINNEFEHYYNYIWQCINKDVRHVKPNVQERIQQARRDRYLEQFTIGQPPRESRVPATAALLSRLIQKSVEYDVTYHQGRQDVNTFSAATPGQAQPQQPVASDSLSNVDVLTAGMHTMSLQATHAPAVAGSSSSQSQTDNASQYLTDGRDWSVGHLSTGHTPRFTSRQLARARFAT